MRNVVGRQTGWARPAVYLLNRTRLYARSRPRLTWLDRRTNNAMVRIAARRRSHGKAA